MAQQDSIRPPCCFYDCIQVLFSGVSCHLASSLREGLAWYLAVWRLPSFTGYTQRWPQAVPTAQETWELKPPPAFLFSWSGEWILEYPFLDSVQTMLPYPWSPSPEEEARDFLCIWASFQYQSSCSGDWLFPHATLAPKVVSPRGQAQLKPQRAMYKQALWSLALACPTFP